MGCGGSVPTASSLNNDQNLTKTVTSTSSSSLATLNQKSNSNRIAKRGRRTDTHEIVQNFLLIWLDANIDESSEDYHNSIKHLRCTVNTIETFQDTEECVDYVS
ncbi:unnamed protein product, partial [Rotaria sp. Silwood2]